MNKNRESRNLSAEFEDLETKEITLGSWRTASLLAFNGFLLAAISTTNQSFKSHYFDHAIPLVGFLISFSVFCSSVYSLYVRAVHNGNTRNIICFCIEQSLGPYIFGGLTMVIFWLIYIFWIYGAVHT